MAKVLTVNSAITCELKQETPPLHGGTVATISTAKLTVSGSPVLLKDGILSMGIIGCKTAPPPQSNKPCTQVASVMAGEASKLTATTMPVMLQETIKGGTDGNPAGFLGADAKQSKLTAI